MYFSGIADFFQNIHWEYVFIFIFMIGFTVESYILYLIDKETNKLKKEYEEVKKKNDELIYKMSVEIESLQNMLRNVRSK